MDADSLLLGVTWYVVFLLSTTCHEAAHALAAKLGGDLTAFHGGQVSLDPVPHIRREPFGMVLFPILSYVVGGWMMGWASAPYDPSWAQRHPRRAAWMSLAGPGANLTLTILAGLAIHAGIWMGVFTHPDSASFTPDCGSGEAGGRRGRRHFLQRDVLPELAAGDFQSFAGPTARRLRSGRGVSSEDGARRFQEFGSQMRGFSMIGLLIAWQVFDPMFDPVFTFALRVLYPGYGYGS